MENGFPVQRNHAFPAGLHVLVVDDDLTWLKILEKMLKKCSYEVGHRSSELSRKGMAYVTTCCLAREALNLLRERKYRYDIVISDVNMPDMDGFKLLEHVGLEMDLPVIMMSVDGETSRVMRGVEHGACDYLLKPIRLKELRNIWQHVLRKRIYETGCIDSLEVVPMTRSASDQYDWQILGGKDHLTSLKKRKDINEHDDKDCADSSCMKKSRVVWSVDLHQKFVDAVNQIGFDKVGPKKILDIMKVPWLTRENVASHLQKYRLYLTRLHKENELQTIYSENKRSDSSFKDTDRNFSLHESVYLYQDNAAEGEDSFSGNHLLQNIHSKSNGSHLQGIVPEPASSATRGNPVSKNKRYSQSEFNHTITSPESKENFKSLNPNTRDHYLYTGATEFQLIQEHKPLTYFESGFGSLQVDQLQSIPPFSSGSSIQENDTLCRVENTFDTCYLNPTRSTSRMDSFQIQPIANNNTFEILAAAMSRKDPSCTTNLRCRLPFAYMDDDFHTSCFETDNSINHIPHEKPDHLPSYTDREISNNMNDALRSSWEYSNDPSEYRAGDQGLYIA